LIPFQWRRKEGEGDPCAPTIIFDARDGVVTRWNPLEPAGTRCKATIDYDSIKTATQRFNR